MGKGENKVDEDSRENQGGKDGLSKLCRKLGEAEVEDGAGDDEAGGAGEEESFHLIGSAEEGNYYVYEGKKENRQVKVA